MYKQTHLLLHLVCVMQDSGASTSPAHISLSFVLAPSKLLCRRFDLRNNSKHWQ